MDAVGIFKGSHHYSELLDSFSVENKLDVDLTRKEISRAIFFHLCKIKYAGWRHRVNFKRKRKHSISDYFQDLLAFYLKSCLPDSFEIELETKVEKTQVDILIKKNGNPHFLIEVKTTIGWERPDMSLIDPYKSTKDRVELLSLNYKIPQNNIIYIYEDAGNVNKEFRSKFWDKEKNRPEKRSNQFPFSIIYPLFNETDPYYWKYNSGFDRQNSYPNLTNAEILSKAEDNIVTPFEDILNLIQTV